MRSIIKKLILIFFFLYSLFFFLGSTLAPILAHFKIYKLSAILTSTYMFSCHQQPDRSFWLLGYPIALCARCYGFYFGVILSSILALFNKLKINLTAFMVIFMICIIDIALNVVFKINTSNIIRCITGIFMGTIFICTLNYMLNLKRRIKNEN